MERPACRRAFYAARRADHPRGPGAFLRTAFDDALLARARQCAGPDRPLADGAAAIRNVLTPSHRDFVRAEPYRRHCLRIRGRVQRSSGAPYAPGARHAAIDSRAEFSSRRDARHGCSFSGTPIGRGIGRGPADFYRAGLEHSVQLLRFAEKYSARNAGSGGDLSLDWCGIP
jgi:hypothetical protein